MRMSVFAVRLMRTTVFTGAALAFAAPAFSQETDTSRDVVTVTGSRVANPGLEQASPISSVGEDEIQLRNSNFAEELLRQLPGVVPSIGPGVNNGQGGAQTINLRGLGANRNLVLVNGRRVVPFGLTGVTDLAHIPLPLIERVDIVTGGGSSVYGADAISGVVNFLVKRDFEGADFDFSYRTTERGDGETFRSALTIGGNFAEGRGNALFSLGYQNTQPVLQGGRSFGEVALFTDDGTPGGSSAAVPAVIAATGIRGPGTSTGQINPATGIIEPFSQPFNFNPLNLYQTPIERYNAYGAARYELGNVAEVFIEGFYTRSNVRSQIAPSASFFNTYELPISNPFLPDPARDQICAAFSIMPGECAAAATVTDPNDPDFRSVNLGIRRRFVESGPRLSDFQTDAFQFTGGLRGDFSDSWSWEASASYGESQLESTVSRFGLFSRLQQSLFAVDETTCVDPSNGCVPFNLFGAAGSITPESLTFIEAPSTTVTDTTFTQILGVVSGDLGSFKSPWSESNIGVAAGVEYRNYFARSAGDFLGAVPGELLGAGGADPITEGRYDVYEVFGETIIPLIQDRPLFHNLTIEGGIRYSDYSTTGGALTWKGGSTWEVAPGWKLRGVYQRATRSPNIAELFFPVQVGLDNQLSDPCAGAISPAVAALCIGQGAPAGTIGSITDPAAGQVNITFGGNPDLDVERATTYTVGLVAQPIDRLTFSVDYFNINVKDAVSSPSVGDVLDGCFDPALNPGLAFVASCALVGRNAIDGSLNGSPADTPGVILQSSNLGIINTSGIDWLVAYGIDLGRVGGLSYQMNGTYTLENRFQATPASIDRECVGFYSTNCGNIQPELQINQRLTWSFDQFDLSLRHRFLSSTEFEPATLATTTVFEPFRNIDSFHYFDLSGRWRITENFTGAFTVDNLFDRSPPIVGQEAGPTAFNSGNTFPTVYDALGRTYTLSIRASF